MNWRILWACVLWGAAAGQDWAATSYVSLDGSDVNGGDAWLTAFRTISNAVARAGNGALTNTIMVSNGTYVLTAAVTVNAGLALRSLAGAAATVLDGNYPATTNRCLLIDHPSAMVDGFTIANGRAEYGGGVWVGTGTVRNCYIQNNTARYGGGVYVRYAGTIYNSVIQSNVSTNITGVDSYGGGIYVFAKGVIENCRVIANHAYPAGSDALGGGIYVHRNTMFKNSLIRDNTAERRGGGIFFSFTEDPGWPAAIHNCTIVNNTAIEGGGMALSRFTGEVVNVILYGNHCPVSASSNLYMQLSAPAFTNCGVGQTPYTLSGSNITNLNPMFVAPAAGDYRLAADSPYINWGMNQEWQKAARDVDGLTRRDPFSDIVDVGAHEFLRAGSLFIHR